MCRHHSGLIVAQSWTEVLVCRTENCKVTNRTERLLFSLSLSLRLSGPLLSPGISPLKAPSPSTLVEKQQNLSSAQQHHKSYSTFHNLTEGTERKKGRQAYVYSNPTVYNNQCNTKSERDSESNIVTAFVTVRITVSATSMVRGTVRAAVRVAL